MRTFKKFSKSTNIIADEKNMSIAMDLGRKHHPVGCTCRLVEWWGKGTKGIGANNS